MSSSWVFYRLQSNNNHLFHFPFHQTHLPPPGLDAQLSAAQKSHEKEKKNIIMYVVKARILIAFEKSLFLFA